MMMTTTLVNLKCGSDHPRVVKAASEFPQKLHAVHGDKIMIRESAIYFGDGTTKASKGKGIDVVCSECNHEWSPTANNLLNGYGCPECSRLKNINSAGKRRSPHATQEEKQRAAELRAQGLSYRQIGKELGRSYRTIIRWLDPEQAEKDRQRTAKWRDENLEHHRAIKRRYRQEFPHGKAAQLAHSANRRLLKTNTPEFVFLDDQWHEVDRKASYKLFGESLLPARERKAIQELYLEAQHLTETTGVEHHVDHIQPLAKGGEHLLINLQIIPANENLSKNATFREEDQEELCRRLFNIDHN